MNQTKRENGSGCIVKRGRSFNLRRVNPATGRFTTAVLRNPDGTKCTTMEDARKAARIVNAGMNELEELKDKERTILELARTRRFIAGMEHSPNEMWEMFCKSPSFNANMSAKRLKQLENVVGSYLDWCGRNGVKDCSGLTEGTVAGWLAEVGGGVSNRTYNEYLADIRQVFAAVHRSMGLDANPAADIRARKRQTVGREAFTPEQIQSIMDGFDKGFFAKNAYMVPCGKGESRRMERREVCVEYKPPHLDEMRLAVMLGFMAGCRLADACNLRWKDVDLTARQIKYKPGKTARSSGMTVSVPIVDGRLFAALSSADCSGEFVMPGLAEWHGRNASSLSRSFSKIFECATGVKDGERQAGRVRKASVYGFHALRHTFVSFCANAGISLEICAAIVGHSTVNTTQIYSHVSDTAKRHALMQIADRGGCDDRARLLEWARSADAEDVAKAVRLLEDAGLM